MSWQAAVFALLGIVLAGGILWFERSRPSSRIVAAVAALAALGIAGRLILAPIPNVVATTDVTLLAGYALGPAPGFAVGALSGLISNFWLGQGPWTPWQMAGWGLVGVGGAALAVVFQRRLGRVGLAVAGGLAGLLYGALLDLSVMVNFGGEQSLDRYLALSVRGIPFNIAHAAGNVALMLAAGPAMVRMLDRYRERFEVRWHRTLPAAERVAVGCLVAAVGAIGFGSAAPSSQASTADAHRWLIAAENSDGGWGIDRGDSSSPGMTGWAVLGLEAAGVNPLDVSEDGRGPIDYLRSEAGSLSSTGDLERTILAIHGAGLDPRSFAGRDLVAELRSRRDSDGSWEGQTNLTAFAILAQRAAGVDAGDLGKPAAWLKRIQNKDGGWGSTAEADSEPDSTGAVLQALAVAPGGRKQSREGVKWLAKAQRGDGGFALVKGSSSNAQSTAWAVQGMLAAGVDPSGVSEGGRDPFDYVASSQSGDGHYRYSSSSDQTPVWVTAQALAAIDREPFPIDPVGRDPQRARTGGGDDSPSSVPDGDRTGPGASTGPGPGSARHGGEDGRGKQGSGGPGERERESAHVKSIFASDERGTPYGPQTESGSSLPSTAAILAGLGGLAALLVAGFFLYRRRLP
jgi:energy-coupling factor transport system substrate-specific component